MQTLQTGRISVPHPDTRTYTSQRAHTASPQGSPGKKLRMAAHPERQVSCFARCMCMFFAALCARILHTRATGLANPCIALQIRSCFLDMARVSSSSGEILPQSRHFLLCSACRSACSFYVWLCCTARLCVLALAYARVCVCVVCVRVSVCIYMCVCVRESEGQKEREVVLIDALLCQRESGLSKISL